MTFLKWASSSLLGHVVLFEAAFSVPLCLVLLDSNYTDGTLTVGWALWIVSISGLAGVVVAVLGWHTVTLPLIKRRKDRL
jgi:hypothetical protein